MSAPPGKLAGGCPRPPPSSHNSGAGKAPHVLEVGRLSTHWARLFYATGDRRAAYTVVPGAGLAVPAGASRLQVAGRWLREFRSGNRWIVTFERAGSTCVLTAAAPREREWLVRLATWHGGPATKPAA